MATPSPKAPPVPPGAGLCGRCRHVRTQRSARGSVFVRCGLAEARPDFPRYPALPVRACGGFEERAPAPQG